MKKEEWIKKAIGNLTELKKFIFKLKASKKDITKLLKCEEEIDEAMEQMKLGKFDLNEIEKVKLEDAVTNIIYSRIIPESTIELENKLAKLFTDDYNSLED